MAVSSKDSQRYKHNRGFVPDEEGKVMNFIWETVNKYVPENMADGVFLTTLIGGWRVLVFGIGMLFCMVAAGSTSAGCIVNVMCMALYAAIIFGLFGGIFYLFRHHRPGAGSAR